jgi:AcrR family transcriptional regulator
MARGKREKLVETALELFHREGFHATGIDRILATAGVAKMTLYHHFRSKDELILAALRLRDERFRNEFMRSVDKKSDQPRQRLLAMFDVLAELFCAGESGGCTFINACAEYADPNSPIHRAAADHKRMLLDYVSEIARLSGARDPERLAGQLCILLDGVIVTAQVSGNADSAVLAQQAADLIIREQLGAGSHEPAGSTRREGLEQEC